jgi:alkylation response protein AidB-like acyl-CoA dehydrogenase
MKMDFSFSAEEEAFRREVHDLLEREWPPAWRGGHGAGPAYTDDVPARELALRRRLGERGWVALNLPREYGGGGRTIMERLIFADETSYFGAPYSNTATGYVAPSLIRFGSEYQKRTFLPGIASGEIDFALGYTEPNAGSDLAGVQTRAVRDGDDFVISGQKVYTTMAHKARYCWLLARTDPDVPKHKGISLFIVDFESPGVTIRPLWTIDDGRTNEVFFDNVRVPKEHLVGEWNRGWYYVSTALDFERFNGFPLGGIRHVLEMLVEFARETSIGGRPLKDEDWVRSGLADVAAQLQAATALQYRAAWMAEKGEVPNAEASMLKLFASELLQKAVQLGSRMLGLYGAIEEGSKWAYLNGRLARGSRGSLLGTFAGGSNEIQRNIIATRGLGLPR